MRRLVELPPDEQAMYRLVLRHMIRLAGSYAVPIVFGEPAWKRGHLSGATGFVVRTPSEHLVITASHVLAGFEQFSAESAEAIWQVGGFGFDPRGKIAFRNVNADVVAVRLTESEAGDVGSTVASCPCGWPPPSPNAGDHVCRQGSHDLSRGVRVGEEVVIMRYDKPGARLVTEGAQRSDDVRRAVAGLRELQEQIRRRSKAKLSNKEVRSAIDEGRW